MESSSQCAIELLTPEQELERGFICRVFLSRGYDPLCHTYGTAKSCGITADCFSDPFSKVVWLSAEDLFAKKDAKDITLVAIVGNTIKTIRDSKDEELKAVQVRFENFDGMSRYIRNTDSIQSYCQLVKNEYMKRRAKQVMQLAIEEMTAGNDASVALSNLINKAQNVLSMNNPCNKLSISELCDKAISDWDEAYHQRTELGNYEWCPGIKLPWRKLAYTLNGFTPDVTVIAARPGVGKTSLALNFTRFWLDNGYKVVFVSVDMSPIGFVKRQLSERSAISSRQLQFGKSEYYKQDREKLLSEINMIKGLEDSGNFTLLSEHNVEMIKSLCAILKDQNKIDVLVVDYLQLLNYPGSEHVSSTQRATIVSNTLHAISVSLRIPVLCLSQLNRENTKDGGREPQLSDLRDSGAIEQDAANVLLLYRNEQLYAKWRSSEPPVQFAKNKDVSTSLSAFCPIWCSVAKCRDGDAGLKLPFVVVQNKYAWYLGDYKAEGDERFARVHDDWRHAPMEKIWENNGALIKMADIRAIEQFNINKSRREKGLPEIQFANPDQSGDEQLQQEECPF